MKMNYLISTPKKQEWSGSLVTVVRWLPWATLVFCLILAIPVSAQQDPINPERGRVSGASYSVSGIETINTTNGNFMLNIPLVGLPKGRGEVTNSISLVYNSKLYDTTIEEALDQSQQMALQNFIHLSNNGGWKYVESSEYYLDSISRFENGIPWYDCNGNDAGKNAYSIQVVMHMPDGSSQEFRPTGFDDIYNDGFYAVTPGGFNTSNCNSGQTLYTTGGMTYYSTDGSYMKLVVNYDGSSNGGEWNLYMNDGSRVQNAPGIGIKKYDRNGNYILGYTDNFGRNLTLDINAAQDEDHIKMNGFNNEELVWKVKWKTINVNKSYDTTGVSDGPIRGGSSTQTINWNIKMVDTVTLPSQLGSLQYKFEYNTENGGTGWGEISKVTMPFGAITEYEFQAPVPFLDRVDQILLRYPSQKTLKFNEVYDGQTTAATPLVWTYDINKTNSTITAPDGTVTTQQHGDTSYEHKNRGLVFSVSDNHGNITEKIWEHVDNPADNVVREINAHVKTEFTTIPDWAGNPSLTKIVESSIDPNGNSTEVKEYDWVSYASVPKDGAGNATGVPAGAVLLRKTVTDYYNSSVGDNTKAYWHVASPNVRDAVKSVELRDGAGNPVSRSEIEYDNPATTANPVKSKQWDSFKGGVFRPYSNPLTSANSIETTASFDTYGNATLTTDTNGVQTKITYGVLSMPAGSFDGIYPTKTETAYGLPEGRTTTADYDVYTGLPTLVTDTDNGVSTEMDYDDFGRQVTVKEAVGTSVEVQTRTEYGTQERRVVVKSDLDISGDGKLVVVKHFDELGRVRLTRTLEDAATEDPYDEKDGIKIQNRYLTSAPCSFDAQSNCSATLVSNPYRADYSNNATNEDSMGWTLTQSRSDGTYSETESFGGYALPDPFAVSGGNQNSTGLISSAKDAERTLFRDQAGKRRISGANAVGLVIDVWEVKSSDSETVALSFPSDPSITHGYKTSYTYDPLNNLTAVDQGTQTRTFTYSSLSRLKTAANPESGTISHTYDNNGNLTQRTDARGVVTTFQYDNINRVIERSYTNVPGTGIATPTVYYTYDDISSRKGLLTKIENANSTTEYTEYDLMGKITKSKQTTDGTSYNEMEYTYNLAGGLVKAKYPSGREVEAQLDQIGRISTLRSKKTQDHGTWEYAKGLAYAAVGAVSELQLGNGKWESTNFNSRLQPTQIALGTVRESTDKLDLDFEYNSGSNADNNGNVLKQTITVPAIGTAPAFTATQTYTYDELNRLDSASETGTDGWTQQFVYDRYGNKNYDEAATTTLTKNCGTGPIFEMCDADREIINPEIDPDTNRIKELQPDGDSVKDYEYDASGNTTKDPTGNEFFYDGENKQTKIEDSQGNTIGEYFYDGDGKRVKKVVPSTGETTIFHYDAAGKLIAEYSTIVNPAASAKVSYLTQDHLGSPRIISDKDGDVISRRDFLPFGEELTASITSQRSEYGSNNIRQGFTGYERDGEIGLNFAQARMQSDVLSRFTSPDPVLSSGRIQQPASWNRYVYVLNNPLKLVDPLGLWDWDASLGGGETDTQIEQNVCRTDTCTEKEIQEGKRTRAEATKILTERRRFREALDFLRGLLNFAVGAESRSRLFRILVSFGSENDGNGVRILSEAVSNGWQVVPYVTQGKGVQHVHLGGFFNNKRAWALKLIHEGQHIVDHNDYWYNLGPDYAGDVYEERGFEAEGIAFEAFANKVGARQGVYPTPERNNPPNQLWNGSWKKGDVERLRAVGAKNIVADPAYNYQGVGKRRMTQHLPLGRRLRTTVPIGRQQ